MISLAQFKLSRLSAKRRLSAIALFGAVSMIAAGCGVQETNTYPIEIFSEMHYAQFYRAQEPPVLQRPAASVAFESAGGPEASLTVPERQQREYDQARAADLYRINCSVCHGINGEGDGRAEPHLTSNNSFYTSQTGSTYAAPPNLLAIRDDRSEQALFNVINSGIVVMPSFGKLMTEEQIWDVVRYIKDEQGLGTAQ